MDKPSYLNFNTNSYPWRADIDYRNHPELYRVGKGEQGVVICEPYKSEIGQYWRFKNVEAATQSSTRIVELFHRYLEINDFVGADMARKYLQMGFTRARRYANYKGGKKYDKDRNYLQFEKGTGDPEKALAAAVFYKCWQDAERDVLYAEMKIAWKQKYG